MYQNNEPAFDETKVLEGIAKLEAARNLSLSKETILIWLDEFRKLKLPTGNILMRLESAMFKKVYGSLGLNDIIGEDDYTKYLDRKANEIANKKISQFFQNQGALIDDYFAYKREVENPVDVELLDTGYSNDEEQGKIIKSLFDEINTLIEKLSRGANMVSVFGLQSEIKKIERRINYGKTQ